MAHSGGPSVIGAASHHQEEFRGRWLQARHTEALASACDGEWATGDERGPWRRASPTLTLEITLEIEFFQL
jgi:hypothetical protein